MVRALKLENRFSGSYYNLSQGMTAQIGAAPAPPPPSLQIARLPQGLVLTWSTQPGATYHVETRNGLLSNWVSASGPLQANGNTLSWTNSTPGNGTAYFRVAAP
jgi:hypothetical protein